MRTPRVLVPAVLALALVLTACGGDDGPDREAYVEAVAETIADDPDVPDDLDPECLAEALVDAAGVDQLDDAGISPEDFGDADSFDDLDVDIDDDAQEQLGDDLADCGFVEAALRTGFEQQGLELESDNLGCIADAVRDGEFMAILAETFVTGDEPEAAVGEELVIDGLLACPAAAAELFLAGFAQSFGGELPPAAEACVAEQLEANPDAVAAAIREGGAGASAQAFGEQIGAACASTFGG